MPESTIEGNWIVDQLAIGGELIAPLDGGRTLTLEVEGDRVGGSAGVNRFMGGLGEDTPFPILATTMMAGPPDLMSQERIYVEHLQSVDSFERDETELRLIAGGLIVVVLSPAGTAPSSATS